MRFDNAVKVAAQTGLEDLRVKVADAGEPFELTLKVVQW